MAFIFCSLSMSYGNAQEWKSTDYQNHTYESFFELDEIYQPLDKNNIKRSLLHAAMFYVTNEIRIKHGIEPFIYDEKYEKIAADHANDMVIYNFYSHISKIKGKKTIRDRINLAGINPKTVAENISINHAFQYQEGRKVYPPENGEFQYATGNKENLQMHSYISFAREVLKLWMNSPNHKANILNPTHQYIGCGAMIFSEKTFYNMPYFKSVQSFGSKGQAKNQLE